MRLYLSSFRLGDQPQRLVSLARQNKSAAVIFNACDFLTESERQMRLDQEITGLLKLGFNATEVDLRNYFESGKEASRAFSAALTGFGLIWVRGGNAFVLRKAMRASGFDKLIKGFLEDDLLVYGGYSAGICVLAPSLRGLELVDEVHSTPAGYSPSIVWEGLGVLPYAFAPHYKSNHPESAQVDALVRYYTENRIAFRTLQDGQAIVIDGDDEETVCGEVRESSS
jgi:dipeptidase E